MSKTRDLGNITNVIKVDATGNVSFVSGSTTLATISTSGQMSGSLPALSSSYALSASYVTNAETLDGLDSTVFTLTSSFNTTSASLYTVSSSAYATSGSLSATSGSLSATSGSLSATSGSLSAASGSLSAASGSFNTRVTDLEVTGSALSSSILSVSASSYLTSGSLSSASGSFDTRISTVESKYATTGSNTFIGTQIISGSILQSGSFTSTGTLTAQTLVVQTITSSVVYSSGSNIFGNSIGNSQVFTGSVLITGSLSLNSIAIPTSASLASTYLQLAGGTLTGQTLVSYAMGGDNGFVIQHSNLTQGISIGYSTIKTSGTSANQNLTFYSQGTGVINLVSDTQVNGIFTALSTITGTTIYGSTAVCSPVGYFSGCVGIGTINPGTKLEVYRCETDRATVTRLLTLNNNSVANPYDGFGMGILFKGTDYSNAVQCYGAIDAVMEFSNRSTPQPDTGFCARMAFSTGTNGALTERMRISSGGNVGIGTCSPNFKTHISTGSDTSITQPTAGTYGLYIQQNTSGNIGGLYIQDGASNSGNSIFVGDNNGAARFVVNTDGNIGIGISSPSSVLDVQSAASIIKLKSTTGTNSVYTNYENCSNFYVGTDSTAGGSFGKACAAVLWQVSCNSIVFATSNTEQMRITGGGNVGIGITPNAWARKVLQIQNSSLSSTSNNMFLGSNYYDDGSNNIYISSGYSLLYGQQDGSHIWYNSPSCSAGTSIAYVARMSITSAGTVQMGMMGLNTDRDYTRYGASTKVVDNAAVNLATMFPNVTIGTALIGLKITAYAYSGGNQGTFEWLAVRAYNADTWTTTLIGSATTGITPTISFGGTNAAPTVTISSATYITAKYEIFSR